MIGRLSATGTGIPTNIRAAARWFLKAADQGHATAAYNIAIFYLKGTGVDRNSEQAVKYFERAASAGVTAAQVQLGKLHAAGEGVPRDDAVPVLDAFAATCRDRVLGVE